MVENLTRDLFMQYMECLLYWEFNIQSNNLKTSQANQSTKKGTWTKIRLGQITDEDHPDLPGFREQLISLVS